ncbi:MAG: hypothetical protein US89_C0005G0004 [Candidatus Peregrinibacteria bacterium GW2011_GWF2_38_29]|nr:MAG: hypothetical protein US89_C0005G0004 [Candidatus Peregrinibacteria bacterium GW2011_GWF2_38_29]
MKTKSQLGSVTLSRKAFAKLEKMLKENDSRNYLNKQEKELLEGSKKFDKYVASIANGK